MAISIRTTAPFKDGDQWTFTAIATATGRNNQPQDGEIQFLRNGVPDGNPIALEQGSAAKDFRLPKGNHDIQAKLVGGSSSAPKPVKLGEESKPKKPPVIRFNQTNLAGNKYRVSVTVAGEDKVGVKDVPVTITVLKDGTEHPLTTNASGVTNSIEFEANEIIVLEISALGTAGTRTVTLYPQS